MPEADLGDEAILHRMLALLGRSNYELDWYSAFRAQVENDLDDVMPCAIGLDTNVLKALRREPLYADALVGFVSSKGIPLIIPGQVVQEFWNNHSVFARDAWNPITSDLRKVVKNLEKVGSTSTQRDAVTQVNDQLQVLLDDLQDYQDPDLLARSLGLWDALLPASTTNFVPRELFAPLGRIRIETKTPPGFEDAGKASNALGDFFVWTDFLFGLLKAHETDAGSSADQNPPAVFITDDLKDDWRTAGYGHPILLAECKAITGLDLKIMDLRTFRGWVKDVSA